MRRRLESVVTEPTEERVVGAPRCCWSATAGGRPSMESTAGTGSWGESRRAEVAALRFRVKCSERERGLAGAGNAGEDDECIAGNIDVDIAKIVLASATNTDDAITLGFGFQGYPPPDAWMRENGFVVFATHAACHRVKTDWASTRWPR